MKSEKITDLVQEPRRSYGDACGTAHALDLIGERWALLVMRELFWGPRRFSDLRADLPGISANVLTQRLEGLEAAGIVLRKRLPPPASVQVYDLTDWGRESEPIFQTLGRWASRSPTHDPTKSFSAASFLLSMRTMFSAERAKGLSARVGFVLGEQRFLATISPRGIAIAHDDLASAQMVFTARPAVMGAAIYGGVPLTTLEKQGLLRIEGDRMLAKKFVTLFPLPEKVAAHADASTTPPTRLRS